jgi:hypothetical protein
MPPGLTGDCMDMTCRFGCVLHGDGSVLCYKHYVYTAHWLLRALMGAVGVMLGHQGLHSFLGSYTGVMCMAHVPSCSRIQAIVSLQHRAH